MIRRPPRSTQSRSSAASDVYKRQGQCRTGQRRLWRTSTTTSGLSDVGIKKRYLYIPQGLNASLDKWCRRSDAIIDGLPWARKIVDDILVWAPNLEDLKSRVEQRARNCEKLNIILSKKKFQIGTSLPFAGYIVSNNGVRPDPNRVEAIRKFPTPNATGVRSFLGLTQQLSFFMPDFSYAAVAMRQLLGKNKLFRCCLLYTSPSPRDS